MIEALPRWAEINTFTGAPGTGKSTLADKVVKVMPYKNAIIVLQYVDLVKSMERGNAWYDYPYLNDIKKYAGGKVKICAEDIDDVDKFFWMLVKHFRNGVLVIDEAGLYKLTWNNPDNQRTEAIPPLKMLWKQKRKYNVSTLLLYHEVSEIPVQIMAFINNFILFHQTGQFRNKNAVPRIADIQAAMQRIQAKYMAGNRYYSETIKLS